jgi:hypothetical protein
MAANAFDQASRYLVRLDPVGFLRWLFAGTLRFLGWLETRSIPFPGEPDRTGDTVACVEDERHPGPLWAVPIEFQSEPDADMFGRLLEYLGSVWRQKRPPERPGERYGVVGCIVNLTGQGDCRRDFQLGPARTLLQPVEFNLAAMDAAATLNAIAAGEVARCALAFIPLMQRGGEDGIIAQWLEIARAEPNERKRGDYSSLALVFAELTKRRAPWQEALKGWNVKESQQVLEWQAEAEQRGEKRGEERGELRGVRNSLRIVLENRFGMLSEEFLRRLDAVTDLGRLQAALKQATGIQTPDELHL